jgi:hypothetical protein
MMPVRKYRSIKEMPDETWHPGDPLLYRTMRQLRDFGRRTTTRRVAPGVRKYRSIDEMSRAQESESLSNLS